MSRWLVSLSCGVLLAAAPWCAADEPLPPGTLARLTPPSRRGSAEVTAIAVTPDGTQVAAVGEQPRGLQLWRLGTGVEHVGGSDPLAVACSPDGKLIATGGWGHVVSLRGPETGQVIDMLRGHAGGVTAVAFSPDGKLLASGSDDRTVRLWDVAKAAGRTHLEGHEGLITAVAFGPEGKTVVSASLDRTVRVSDLATGKELRRLEGHRDEVLAIRLIPDGPLATASMDHTVRLWDPATGKELRKLEGHELGVMSVDASADGKRLVSGSLDGTVRVWDVATGKELLKVTACDRGVRAVAFLPDGKSVVSGDSEGSLRRWDAVTGKELEAVAPDKAAEGPPDSIHALDWSPDGERIVTASAEGIRLWDAASGKMLRLLGRLTDEVWDVVWSPDGKQVVAVGRRDGSVHAWDPDNGEELFLYGPAHKGGVSKAAFSRDGKRLASGGGSFDPTVYVWDTKTGKLLKSLEAPMQFLEGLAWSPDGKRLASVARDNVLRVWDVEAGKELRQFSEPARTFRHVAWSPDGRRLATSSEDHTAYLWDVDGPAEPRPLGPEPGASSKSAVFSPDGRLVAVGPENEDGSVWLLETATGQPRVVFEGKTGYVSALGFAPDGRRVAAAGSGGVLVWDVTGLAGRPTKKLTDDDLTALWQKLDGEAKEAHAAVWGLVAAPEQAVRMLKGRLRPAMAADPEKVARLVKDLDDEGFAVRDRASKELEKLGDQAEEALQQELKKSRSLEVRIRAEALLAKLEGPAASPERLRQLRALEVLEHAATPKARELTKGAPTSWLTREANASLKRLDSR